MEVPGLDQEAWTRWLTYRQAIKKPYKDISLHAAALKLSSYGPDQAQVVERSIANQWQGLFDPERKKIDPGAPKERTSKEKDADAARFSHANKENERGWTAEMKSPLGKLKLAAALLARYDVLEDGNPMWAEKREWLKGQVAALLRQTDPALVLAELEVKRLVLRLYNDAGLRRLEIRAKAQTQEAAA